MLKTAFDIFHPAVALAYFASVLVLVMLGLQPIFATLWLTSGLLCSAGLHGWRATARSLSWITLVIIAVATFNMIVSTAGATVLFTLGERPFTAESLVFGLTQGAMLGAVMLWFANAGAVLTSDKVMHLLGGRLPTLSLLISMTMRLVPQFVRQGRAVDASQQACTAARDRRHGLRLMTVLMGWSMENSLETASAMKARGWGCGLSRTAYQRYRFGTADGVALVAILALAIAAAVGEIGAVISFSFYPTLSAWSGPATYAAPLLLSALPFALAGRERLLWS